MEPNTQLSTTERHLTDAETERLQAQGCTAADWSLVTIHPETDLQYVHDVRFIGRNHLGRFRKIHETVAGIFRHSGIYRATLCGTTVGDDCLIEDIAGGISHYDIGEECLIRHTDTLVKEGTTTFGQGTEIAVLSETGGREIVIHDKLSAQEAYLQAMYRHDAQMVDKLHTGGRSIAHRWASKRAQVGAGSRIIRCGFIRNVMFGEACRIEGVTRLDNGTVCSQTEAPAYVGERVIARDFIIQTGCKVTDGAMLTRCYVGQSSVIGHGFSASDVYFGCNCQAENGEACAVFAGPYTVTHHKSTLLIGGMFSFMNAGSGTNQSNHMYKLGPSHQGILERGCKTASGSHILWPARAGAFSMIMGHYTAHADTGLFPFSYIVEQQNGNYLIPGIALRNVGTLRDIRKWPQRDLRPQPDFHTDLVSFEAFSPYTMGKIRKATMLMEEWLRRMTEDGQAEMTWQGLHLKRSAIERGLVLYRQAWARFIGDQLLKRLQACGSTDHETLYRSITSPQAAYCETWCDAGGWLVPQTEMNRLTEDIKTGNIDSPKVLRARTLYMYNRYDEYVWAWVWHHLKEERPEPNTHNFAEKICMPLLRAWKEAALDLNAQIIADAEKEFAPGTRTGFGIDGNESVADADFLAVRGCPEDNGVIQELRREQEEIQHTFARWENILTR